MAYNTKLGIQGELTPAYLVNAIADIPPAQGEFIFIRQEKKRYFISLILEVKLNRITFLFISLFLASSLLPFLLFFATQINRRSHPELLLEAFAEIEGIIDTYLIRNFGHRIAVFKQ